MADRGRWRGSGTGAGGSLRQRAQPWGRPPRQAGTCRRGLCEVCSSGPHPTQCARPTSTETCSPSAHPNQQYLPCLRGGMHAIQGYPSGGLGVARWCVAGDQYRKQLRESLGSKWWGSERRRRRGRGRVGRGGRAADEIIIRQTLPPLHCNIPAKPDVTHLLIRQQPTLAITLCWQCAS